MREFIITNDQANALFVETQLAERQCMVLSMFQEYVHTCAGQVVREMKSKTGERVVFEVLQHGNCKLWFIAMCENENYTVEYVSSQLKFLQSLFIMRVGFETVRELARKPLLTLYKHRDKLQRWVATWRSLREKWIGYSLLAVEHLNVNAQVREKCNRSLSQSYSTVIPSSDITVPLTVVLLHGCRIVGQHNASENLQHILMLPIISHAALQDDETVSAFDSIYLSEGEQLGCVYAHRLSFDPNLVLCVVGADPQLASKEDTLVHYVKSVERELREVAEYIIIQGGQHLTTILYTLQLPGLVSFLFVDRSSGVMIAPTHQALCSTDLLPMIESALLDCQTAIMDLLWPRACTMRANGVYHLMWKWGGLILYYRLWVESSEVRPSDTLVSVLHSPSAIKNLLGVSARVYEICAVFAAPLTFEAVSVHGKRLAKSIMEEHSWALAPVQTIR